MCCLHNLECVAFCCSSVTLPRLIPLKQTVFFPATVTFPQFLSEIWTSYLFFSPSWNFSGLSLHRLLACCHTCCEFISAAILLYPETFFPYGYIQPLVLISTLPTELHPKLELSLYFTNYPAASATVFSLCTFLRDKITEMTFRNAL